MIRGFAWTLALSAALSTARPGAAASLQEVTGFGTNPSNTRMFLYVPDKVAPAPPILVAIHYCGGSANAYFTGTGYHSLADQYGFIVIYPQTTSSDGCFDVHSDATLKHDGGSDSLGIVSMVRYTIPKYGADATRVYVTGTSSGAMMTNVLLGAYPDVFRAGAAFAGVPYACFAGQSAWSTACATGQITKTGQEWGDLVRAAFPGYTGPRPRVQLWHGTADQTLDFHNFGEEIKEWTNVLGVSETPSTTEQNTPQSGFTRTRYKDGNGIAQVEGIVEQGATHNLTVLASEAAHFFGLDGMADPGGPRGTGAAGAAGSGMTGGGGSTASGGSTANGGATGNASGGSAGTTIVGTAGAPGGGAPAAGGGSNSGSGGAPSASGGANAGGAVVQGASGAGGASSGGASSAAAGQSAAAVTSGNGGSAIGGNGASSSCSVRGAAGRTRSSAVSIVVALAALCVRRSRSTRRRRSSKRAPSPDRKARS
ncbi:MAG TPA: PHB depolymerase family esterase [Polyangiaceae bacterium]|nr:PHB depolymerase family esterase [Polyangiaceae bacterium]